MRTAVPLDIFNGQKKKKKQKSAVIYYHFDIEETCDLWGVLVGVSMS